MTIFQRAWRCLSRKRGKTALLGLVMLLASVLILGATVVTDATVQAAHALAAQTQAKLICESTSDAQPLAAADAKKIAALDGVARVNRRFELAATPEDVAPVTKSDAQTAENSQMRLIGYDDLAQDGPFADGSYQLTRGALATGAADVVVNEILAAQNRLDLGDALTLQTADGASHTLRISGLFRAGNEARQSDASLAVARIENQLFATAGAVSEAPDAQLSALSVVSDAPDALTALEKEVRAILGDRAEIADSDSLYEQLVAPLAQLGQIVQLARGLAIIAATLIVALLLALWMRGRRQEMAIFLSLGMRKWALYAQAFLESALVFIAALLLATGIVALAAQLWGDRLAQALGVALTLRVQAEAVGMLAFGGVFLVAFAVLLAMLPILLRAPKTLLSGMEE